MTESKVLTSRKQLVIDPKFQKEAALFFLVIMLLGISVFFILCMTFGYYILQTLAEVNSSLAEQILANIALNQEFLIYLSIAALAISIITTIVLSFYFTNRISGPIYRIDTDLKKMMETGEFKKIKIRDADFCGKHLDVINKLIEDHLKK